MKVKDCTRDRLVVETFAWRFGLIMLLGDFSYAALNEHDGGARWRSIVAILAFAVPAWGMSYRTVVIFDRMRDAVTGCARAISARWWRSMNQTALRLSLSRRPADSSFDLPLQEVSGGALRVQVEAVDTDFVGARFRAKLMGNPTISADLPVRTAQP